MDEQDSKTGEPPRRKVDRGPTSKRNPKDEPMSFEVSLLRLSDVVRDLEVGELTLDESLQRYEEGIRRLNDCQRMLAAAERKVEVLQGFDQQGQPILTDGDEAAIPLEAKSAARGQRRTAASPHFPVKKNGHVIADSSSITAEDQIVPDERGGGDVDNPGTLF